MQRLNPIAFLCVVLASLLLTACYSSGSAPSHDLAEPAAVKPLAKRPQARSQGLFSDGGRVVWPALGRVSSEFGWRGRRPHKGIDISGKRGSPIFAVERGRVSFAGRQRGYGRVVIVRHRGYDTLYAHCHKILVKKGQKVRQGQMIAGMGATGNATGVHLHFEWRLRRGGARDPRQLLARAARHSVDLSQVQVP